MALPETISVRRAEEDAGYMAMTPVVTQTFRLSELVDMVVSVTGKNPQRVQHVFAVGTVLYNGFHYTWPGLQSEPGEIAMLLAAFPDDDPSRTFDPMTATGAILEIGGGTQRKLVEISRETASVHRMFSRRTPWDALLTLTKEFSARYEKYDHAKRADLFRVSLRFEEAQNLLQRMIESAPRQLRFQWRAMHPPAAVLFVSPRNAVANQSPRAPLANASGSGSS